MEMASETGSSDQSSFIEALINSSNRGIPLFLPFILGLTSNSQLQDSANPRQETQDHATHGESRDRIILINPLTQSMVVMESSSGSLGLESLFGDLFSIKSSQRPASKASIDAMPSVEIVNGENDDENCVVCLEEWEAGEMAKEMPCKHRFHGNCIEKWLKINGSCPVCRYEMPVDEDEDADAGKRTREESDGERRRGIWVSVTFGGGRRNWENNQTSSNESNENSDSSSNHQETEA